MAKGINPSPFADDRYWLILLLAFVFLIMICFLAGIIFGHYFEWLFWRLP